MRSEFYCHSCMKWEPSERIGGVVSEKRYCVDTIDKARKRVAEKIKTHENKPVKVKSDTYTEAQLKEKRKVKSRIEDKQQERELKQLHEDIYGYEDM